MARSKLKVIEDSTLSRMADQKEFTTAFSFLKPIADLNKRGGCAPCQRKRQKQRAAIFQAVKQNIAGLSSDKKQKLKEMLNADNVRVTYRRPDGKFNQLTF